MGMCACCVWAMEEYPHFWSLVLILDDFINNIKDDFKISMFYT